MLQYETKLLWAVQAKLPYKFFGITEATVSRLLLVKCYIVSICKEVLELHFPLSVEDLQHITIQLCNGYYNNLMKTDNINVINDENSIPWSFCHPSITTSNKGLKVPMDKS